MELILENWRKYLDEEEIIQKWAQATGMSPEELREGISRRDFLRGLGGAALSGLSMPARGETGDTAPPFADARRKTWGSSRVIWFLV